MKISFNPTWIHQSTAAEGIAAMSWQARAHSDVVLNLTFCIDSALSNARIDANPIFASLVQATFDVIRAFTSVAVAERVTAVARRAGADWTSSEGFLAHCVGSAWVARAALT